MNQECVEDHETYSTDNENVKRRWFQCRHIFIFMGFFGFANVYAMRVNLSVAIVAMVNSSDILTNSSDDTCGPSSSNSTNSNQHGEFDWEESLQGLILSAFFWGYIITNPIGGRIADISGGKRVFCFGVFCTSLLTLLSPVASKISPYMLIVLRFMIGLAEGVTFPAMNSMLAKWIPPLERTKAVSLIYSGAQAGIVIAYPLCGIMCNSTFLDGWPLAFYVFGFSGIIWCSAFLIIVYDSPESHPSISNEEKHLINSSLTSNIRTKQILPVPWKQIATSLPFWAILITHVTQNYGFYFLLTELPTYLDHILHFDIKENSLFAALPYLMMWWFGILMGILSDELRKRDVLSTSASRQIFNSISAYGSMVCLVCVGYSGCDVRLTLVLLTLGVGLNGASMAGFLNSHLDIASNYAGTLFGLTNCIATIPGFVAPAIVGQLITGNETLSQWRIMFWIAGIVLFFGNTVYVLLMSGEEQPWNTMYKPLLEDVESEYGNITNEETVNTDDEASD